VKNKDHLPDEVHGALVDYERSRVPHQQARGWFSLSTVFLGICVGIPPMVLGSNLAAGMGFQKAFSAIIWGSLIAMPICVLAAHVGTKSRLSTGMTLKFAFGSIGSRIISGIIALDMFCWAAMNMEIFTDSLRSTSGFAWASHLSKPSLSIGAGLLMVLVTIFGYRSMEKFAFLMVPALLAVVLTYFFYVLHITSVHDVVTRPALSQPIQYATAVSIIAGSYLNLSVLLPDYTRYSKGPIHSAIAVISGLCLGLPLFVLIACYLTAATKQSDFVKLMALQGWGSIVILVIAITCWFHMNSCLYSASLNLSAIIRRAPKWKLTIFGGVIATGVAMFGIVARYVSFLVLLSISVPPISGVYTADYILRRNLYQFGPPEGTGHVRPIAIVSLFTGILTGFMTAGRGDMGFGLFHLTFLPAIDSFLASFACQLILGKLLGERLSKHLERRLDGEGREEFGPES
jgi:cytosine permease